MLDSRQQYYVLVCSNSNAACNEILGRLAPILSHKDILRLYAISHDRQKVDSQVTEIENRCANELLTITIGTAAALQG